MKRDLTEGHVSYVMLKMTIPMIGGMLAMSVFNLTDTYFVSRLGTDALAAMSFTFPVVMIVFSLAMGLAIGTSSCISRAYGAGKHQQVQRLTTDSLLLSFLTIGVISIIGIFTMDYQFKLLGAPDHLIPLIREYMLIWYSCVAFGILPMIGNNAIRATGNTLVPSLIMAFAAILNVILDPIFIFGWFGIPALGLKGAAIATVISRLISLVASFCILHYKCRQLDTIFTSLKQLLRSWQQILHVALPSMGTYLLLPLSTAYITRIIAVYGEAAVAGTGAGSKIQHFAYLIPMAFGTTLVPFIGQNSGAKRLDRIYDAWHLSNRAALIYGLLCFIISLPAAPYIAALFSDDRVVTDVISVFLWLAMIGSGFQHLSVHTGFILNAMGHARQAAYLSSLRVLGLVLPLAYIGSRQFGLHGIFGGLTAAQILSGIIAYFWMKSILTQAEQNIHYNQSQERSYTNA